MKNCGANERGEKRRSQTDGKARNEIKNEMTEQKRKKCRKQKIIEEETNLNRMKLERREPSFTQNWFG